MRVLGWLAGGDLHQIAAHPGRLRNGPNRPATHRAVIMGAQGLVARFRRHEQISRCDGEGNSRIKPNRSKAPRRKSSRPMSRTRRSTLIATGQRLTDPFLQYAPAYATAGLTPIK